MRDTNYRGLFWRIFSAVLGGFLLLSVCTTLVFAEQTEVVPDDVVADEELITEVLDGDVLAAETQGETLVYDGIEFQPWESTTSLPYEMNPGNYYLTGDVTLSSTWVAPQDTTYLYLNGHSITLSQDGEDSLPVIRVAQYDGGIPCALVLYDEAANEGAITHESGKLGCGVRVVNGGEFVMKGGNISNNIVSSSSVDYGGGVIVDGGMFTMEGGAIANNGGVYCGGGVAVKSGTFTMEGGTIANNGDEGVKFGGGVYVRGGIFNLRGGTITYNTARFGGGVAVDFSNQSSNQVFMSGSPKVTDSQASSPEGTSKPKGDNLCLVWPKEANNRIPITINGALGEDAKIGISTIQDVSLSETGASFDYTDGVFTSGYKEAQSGDPRNYFTSDNPDYVVYWTPDGQEAQFRKKSPEIHVSYTAHVQKKGDLPAVSDGEAAGTTGESRRLEALSAMVDEGGIEYRAHIQSTGWGDWVADGKQAGTIGEARRLEAIQMRLTGTAEADGFHVWYRVHSQTYGWLGWACDGEPAGTTGMAKRAEAYQVVVLQDNEKPDDYDASKPAYLSQAVANGYLQGTGWTGNVRAGVVGTTGKARRMEGLRLSVPNQPFAGGITYQVHEQGKGWTAEKSDGALAGTTGESRRIEAVRIHLTGEMANHLSVWYRVHSQTYGWSGWTCDGKPAGTEGLSRRAEAVDIRILPKDAPAPGSTANAFRTR